MPYRARNGGHLEGRPPPHRHESPPFIPPRGDTLPMAARSTASTDRGSVLSRPTHPLGYIAILAALVTAVVHLLLSQRVMGFDQTLAILFLLNGLGYLGGLGLYLTRYWRRELYLVATAYAVVTILAFFVMRGFGPDAFYMRGDLNSLAVAAKAAELVLAVSAVYLYWGTGQRDR